MNYKPVLWYCNTSFRLNIWCYITWCLYSLQCINTSMSNSSGCVLDLISFEGILGRLYLWTSFQFTCFLNWISTYLHCHLFPRKLCAVMTLPHEAGLPGYSSISEHLVWGSDNDYHSTEGHHLLHFCYVESVFTRLCQVFAGHFCVFAVVFWVVIGLALFFIDICTLCSWRTGYRTL